MSLRARQAAFRRQVLGEVVEFLASLDVAPDDDTVISRVGDEIGLSWHARKVVIAKLIDEMDRRATPPKGSKW